MPSKTIQMQSEVAEWNAKYNSTISLNFVKYVSKLWQFDRTVCDVHTICISNVAFICDLSFNLFISIKKNG